MCESFVVFVVFVSFVSSYLYSLSKYIMFVIERYILHSFIFSFPTCCSNNLLVVFLSIYYDLCCCWMLHSIYVLCYLFLLLHVGLSWCCVLTYGMHMISLVVQLLCVFYSVFFFFHQSWCDNGHSVCLVSLISLVFMVLFVL